MTDRVPSPEETQKFQQWYGSGASPQTAPSASGGSGGVPGQGFVETLGAFGQGALKGFAGMGAPPGGVSLNEADPKGPVATWAKQEQTEHPWAEQGGRWAAEYGPLAALPDAELGSLGGAGARAVARAWPKLSHIAERGMQGAWKGLVGGETQGDAGTGAATGGGTAAAGAAYRMLPPMAQWGLPFAAWEMSKMGGGKGMSAYSGYHLAHPLAALAAALSAMAPGVSGALGAKAFGDKDQQ